MTLVLDQSETVRQRESLTPSSSAKLVPPPRIHYLDNLRAVAMLLGVYLHAALAYAQPAQSVWLATDTTSSVAIDASIWFIHLFRMGLFFLLSGYFAKLVIERKGIRHFMWSRCLRIVGPFVVFYPFLLAAMAVVIVFSLKYLVEPRGLMGLIAEVTKGGQKKSRPAWNDAPLVSLLFSCVHDHYSTCDSREMAAIECAVSAPRLVAVLSAVSRSWSDCRWNTHGSPRVLFADLVAVCILRTLLFGGLAVVRSRAIP